MSFKYNAEDSFPSFPESCVIYTEGDLHGAVGRNLICPSLVGPSTLLPANDERQIPVLDISAAEIPVLDIAAVPSQLGYSNPVDQLSGYIFPYYPWVALEDGRICSGQSPSGSGMKSQISLCNTDGSQQVEILCDQQTAQSSGACGLQDCTLLGSDEAHVKNCCDDAVVREVITDSDSQTSVMSSYLFGKTDRSCRRDDITLAGPADASGKSRTSKCSESLKIATKRRHECKEELECIPKRCRMDTKVCYTPQMLSKLIEVTTETIQVAPSCGQVVEVLRRSTIGRGQDIVYVQNEATPWEPWVTALRDEEGTLTVSPCSSRTSLIEMDDGISMQNVKKDEEHGRTELLPEQCGSCEAKEASLCMQNKEDLNVTVCDQVVDSCSPMLPSLHENVDNLNQMPDITFDSCTVADAPNGGEKSLVDDNYSNQSLDSLILFEELRDFTSEEIVPQEMNTIENSINGFSNPEKHGGKALKNRSEDASCGITPKQRHIQDKCAFLLLEADRELKKMGIRGFSVRLNIDWHQLVVEDSIFGNTFVFPLDEVDFNDRNPIFEDILERLTKDMYSVQSCASKV